MTRWAPTKPRVVRGSPSARCTISTSWSFVSVAGAGAAQAAAVVARMDARARRIDFIVELSSFARPHESAAGTGEVKVRRIEIGLEAEAWHKNGARMHSTSVPGFKL